MKLGREIKGIPSADLLVCFPSRSHLPLLPNPLYSPARGSDRRHHRHRRRKSAESPVVWAKGKTMTAEIPEPSSPKVTCAGQIKLKPKSSKNWESVMEEIEKIHNRRRRRRFNWVQSIGFKKDIMQFLTVLRRFRFDFRCFKAFPETDLTTDDEEEEEKTEEDERTGSGFSKWVMVLEENEGLSSVDDGSIEPPTNALVLMRCRSAPAKSWEEETEEEEVKVKKSLKWLMEEENRERLDSDLFSRSRSWKF